MGCDRTLGVSEVPWTQEVGGWREVARGSSATRLFYFSFHLRKRELDRGRHGDLKFGDLSWPMSAVCRLSSAVWRGGRGL